jgi:uncharacterized DUF497 family protein
LIRTRWTVLTSSILTSKSVSADLGQSANGRVLMVAYTVRGAGDVEKIRLISARQANRRERAAYDAED